MFLTFGAINLLLIVGVTAQTAPPIPCTVVLDSFSDCGGSSLDDNSQRSQLESFNNCFCLDTSYPVVAQECLNQLNPNDPFARSTASAIQQSEVFCATIAQILASGGGGGGGSSPTSISPPSGTPDPAAAVCLPLDNALVSCSVTALPALTASTVVDCLCGANIENGLAACFSYLATAEPAVASGLSPLNKGYCEAYATDASRPTPTQGGGEDGATTSATSTGASAATSSGAASALQPIPLSFFSIFGILAIIF
ncbi:hypothetical protein TWF788_001917 [Orbilia oligospora]|uniref:Extracellular membrane protein CFEM domain-containing protein n=1 Tax=Orbilia oligospora TaxID=2813651 RepID=A0A7C8Q0T7_ORBOL|nr:hypothetical protein TWF788_001917 [Orbilia oligospora]